MVRVLLFRVAEAVYGCEIDLVREIINFRPATRLPGAPSYVCGLVNLRGTILTVVDLAERLRPGERERCVDGSIILVQHGTRTLGLAVDEVMDVQLLPTGRIELASGEATRGGIVRGAGHLEDDSVVILLDMHMLVKQVLL